MNQKHRLVRLAEANRLETDRAVFSMNLKESIGNISPAEAEANIIVNEPRSPPARLDSILRTSELPGAVQTDDMKRSFIEIPRLLEPNERKDSVSAHLPPADGPENDELIERKHRYENHESSGYAVPRCCCCHRARRRRPGKRGCVLSQDQRQGSRPGVLTARGRRRRKSSATGCCREPRRAPLSPELDRRPFRSTGQWFSRRQRPR